jgi:hypothetical protein
MRPNIARVELGRVSNEDCCLYAFIRAPSVWVRVLLNVRECRKYSRRVNPNSSEACVIRLNPAAVAHRDFDRVRGRGVVEIPYECCYVRVVCLAGTVLFLPNQKLDVVANRTGGRANLLEF